MGMFKNLLAKEKNEDLLGENTLGTLSPEDLKMFKNRRLVIANQSSLMQMLNLGYNEFLRELLKKYGVPSNVIINTVSGEIYEVAETNDG